MPEVGEVRYKVTADNSQVNSDIKDTEKQFKKSADKIESASDSANKNVAKDFENSSQKSQSSWAKAGTAIAKGIGTAFVGITTSAVAGTVALAKVGVDFNSQMESFRASFEVMTGDAEEAVRITEQLKDTAAKTPFGMTDLAETTQLLMNYGLSADEAMSSMEMLGDISQGSADKLGRVAAAYGQMSSLGKVQLEDIKQMIEAGFNPLQEISETTGESMESLYARISNGTLAVDEITASMQRSTSEGGKYYQSMEKQSQTLSGQFSTLKDNFAQFAGQVTESLTPALTTAMDTLNELFADPALKEMLSQLFSMLAQIVSEALPQLVSALSGIMPILVEIVNAILPPILGIIGELIPPLLQIVEMILPVFTQLLEILLPPLMQIIQAIMPVLVSLLEVLLPILSMILEALAPILALLPEILDPVLALIEEGITPLIEVLGYLIELALEPLQSSLHTTIGVFEAAFRFISDGFINSVNTWRGILDGLIDFIGGVFSGDWSRAWDGISKIFSSIFGGIANLAKLPINAVIDLINGFLRGLNGIRIPDWVPMVGGTSFSISLIPRLKKGMPFVPSDFFPAYLDYGERVLTREENIALMAAGGIPAIQQAAQAAIPNEIAASGSAQAVTVTVPLYLDGREIARASAWYMGEQLAWEER